MAIPELDPMRDLRIAVLVLPAVPFSMSFWMAGCLSNITHH
jgi:hypothetical protein